MSGGISDKQGKILVELARKTLEHRLMNGDQLVDSDEPEMLERAAVFVTLKRKGKLRGCIGNLTPVSSLWQAVRDNAINAAFNDHRFSPLTLEELQEVRLDISVLSKPEKLQYSGAEELLLKLRPGIDGVTLRDGHQSATFLPQVWKQLPGAEQFLNHLCMKAGLAQDLWRQKDVDVETYQVQSFQEETE